MSAPVFLVTGGSRGIGVPEEAASAVMYLASDEASFVTGANLWVAGGR